MKGSQRSLAQIGTLKDIPGLSFARHEGVEKATPGTRLLDQAGSLSHGLVRNPHTFTKGGQSQPSPLQDSVAAKKVVAEFELVFAVGDNGNRVSQAIGRFHPFVRGADIEFCEPGMPVAFIDRGTLIDVFVDDDKVLRAATNLALARRAESILLHANFGVVDRICHLIARLDPSSRSSVGSGADANGYKQILEKPAEQISTEDLLREADLAPPIIKITNSNSQIDDHPTNELGRDDLLAQLAELYLPLRKVTKWDEGRSRTVFLLDMKRAKPEDVEFITKAMSQQHTPAYQELFQRQFAARLSGIHSKLTSRPSKKATKEDVSSEPSHSADLKAALIAAGTPPASRPRIDVKGNSPTTDEPDILEQHIHTNRRGAGHGE